jgi:hypothetical protein
MFKPMVFFASVAARNGDCSILPMKKQKRKRKSLIRKRNTRTRVKEAKRKLRSKLVNFFLGFCETNICIWHIDAGFMNFNNVRLTARSVKRV